MLLRTWDNRGLYASFETGPTIFCDKSRKLAEDRGVAPSVPLVLLTAINLPIINLSAPSCSCLVRLSTTMKLLGIAPRLVMASILVLVISIIGMIVALVSAPSGDCHLSFALLVIV